MHLVMDVRRAHPVAGRRVGAGDDGHEAVASVLAGGQAGITLEIRVENPASGPILGVVVEAVGVGLPDLDDAARKRPAATCSATSSSKPGSATGDLPSLRAATFSVSISTPMT